MYELLPGVDLFRRPADATFIIGLLLAINTGYLVHRLLTGTAPAPRWWVAVESALMAIPIAIAVAIAHEAGKLDLAMLPVATGVVFAASGIALVEVMRRFAAARPVVSIVLLCRFTVFDLAWNNWPNESTRPPPSPYQAPRPDSNRESLVLLH